MRAQSLYYFVSAFAAHIVGCVLAEDHRITGDFFHGPVEYLVVLPQEIRAMPHGGIGHCRYHLSVSVLGCPLHCQLRDVQAALARDTARLHRGSTDVADRTQEWIASARLIFR